MLASWTILFFIFRPCNHFCGHDNVGCNKALWTSFYDSDLSNLASGFHLDHQTIDRKSLNKRVLWDLDPMNSQKSPTNGIIKRKTGLGRSVSEVNLSSKDIFTGTKNSHGFRPIATGRNPYRASQPNILGTNAFQEKFIEKDSTSAIISPTPILGISSDSESENASASRMSGAGQHTNQSHSSEHFESKEQSPPSSIKKESCPNSSFTGTNSLFDEAVTQEVNMHSIDSVENSDPIERGVAAEKHGRLRLYLPRPNLIKAPPPTRTRRLAKASGILDGLYDKFYQERVVISSLTKKILNIVVHDLVDLDSRSLSILLKLKTLLISVEEKLNNLRKHTLLRIDTTFLEWEESRKKAVEILEKVLILYLESINQLKDTSELGYAHKYTLSQSFLRMIKQEVLEVGLGRFKGHVDDFMRQVEDIVSRDYVNKLDPLNISLDTHELTPFQASISIIKARSKPIEIENVHRDLDSMVEARVSGVLIIDDMSAHIRMLQRVVDTPLSSTFSDFEALEESLLELKECLRTSFTLMAWGFAHNLPPSSLDSLLDDSIALDNILKALRQILDLHPLDSRVIGNPGPKYDDIGSYVAEMLLKSICNGSKILLERLTFMSQEGSQESTGLHWFWGADAALDHFPDHLLPKKSYQHAVSLTFSSETKEEFEKRFKGFLDSYEEMLNRRPFLEFSAIIFSERIDLVKRMIKANKDIASFAKKELGFSMALYILRHCNLWKFCLNQVEHMLQTAMQHFELLKKGALEEINVVHWSAMESLADRILMFRRELEKLLAKDVGTLSKSSGIDPVSQHSHIQPMTR
ncbi:hypothetical protein DFH28DRAFT_970849 [Melampsora americana]|nr:hypothetical protein DFH28DRAFT_970849 [Melampsora americana]